MRQTSYVGYTISEKGIQANPERIKPIMEFPPPHNVKAVRRFIGMAGWYRHFIQNFASEMAPITELLKKENIPFVWSTKADVAFHKIKQILMSLPVLSTPDFSQMFTIQSDASDSGVGAVLTQNINDEEKVIAYFSAKLTKTQKNYAATERECLAVILAVEKFRPYIDGCHFTVITDCSSLLCLQNMREPTSRLARWALRLQAYDFKLLHRKGKHNVVPDALSRMFVNAIELSKFINTTDKKYLKLAENIKEKGTAESTYKYENDLIYKSTGSRHGNVWKILVPTDMVNDVITDGHDDILSGHGGYWKTLERIKNSYFWHKMNIDIAEYVRKCQVCQSVKQTNESQIDEMGGFRDAKYPWRHIACDFIGPLPRSRLGNSWILTVVDGFSKYVNVFPLKTATSELLIDRLINNVFLKFGVLQQITCDNGTQFHSAKFTNALSKYNITPQYTARYHPQANYSESVNKVINNAINIEEKLHDKWDVNLNEIICAINSSAHTQTKKSPYEILYAAPMVVDGQMHQLFADANERTQKDTDGKFPVLWNEVRDALRKAHENAAKGYNLRARHIEYKAGDNV